MSTKPFHQIHNRQPFLVMKYHTSQAGRSFHATLLDYLILIITEQEKWEKLIHRQAASVCVVPPHTSQAGSSLVLRCLRTKNTAILRPPGAPLSCSNTERSASHPDCVYLHFHICNFNFWNMAWSCKNAKVALFWGAVHSLALFRASPALEYLLQTTCFAGRAICNILIQFRAV